MKYSAKEAADLKAALDSITPDHRNLYGICSTTYVHMRRNGHSVGTLIGQSSLQAQLTAQWSLYSGDHMYPLPGGSFAYGLNASRADGGTAARREYMWNRHTSPYAELRWQLIEYLRAQCAAIIEDRRIADKLHHVLLRVQAKRLWADGICDNISSILMSDPNTNYSGKDRHYLRCLMDDLFKTWPEFSGSQSYPVCTVYQAYGGEPREQYITASSAHTMWEGEYGMARRRLLNFLIEQTRPE